MVAYSTNQFRPSKHFQKRVQNVLIGQINLKSFSLVKMAKYFSTTWIVVLTFLLIQISAKQHATVKFFENSTKCTPGKEVVWAAAITNKCINQLKTNFSKENKKN